MSVVMTPGMRSMPHVFECLFCFRHSFPALLIYGNGLDARTSTEERRLRDCGERLAEREGFEPSVPFQASTAGQERPLP